MDGLFPMFWDAKSGHVFLHVSKFDQDFLFLTSLPYGLGSNDIGLDRGKLSDGVIVHFTRIGPKVLLVRPNLEYRSSSENPAERLAVKQSFAESVLAGFKVEAEENDAVLIDVTDFVLSDSFGVIKQLAESKQGSYRVDKERSAIALDSTKNFPLNTEIESMLTFTTDKPADKSLVATVAPDAYAVTLREHYSFVQLPTGGYQSRAFDPRAGYFDVKYRDYSAPLGSPLDLRFIARHRLEKKDPSAAVSEPVKPIVYYVDRGAPEPIRSALVEGANWWAQAFEAAGFKNAFRVDVLPEGADPMDVRYNIIQWVHRSTRGWSYGAGVIDPRTGEIIKGQVTLGSLRARQDYMIAEALLSPYHEGVAAPTRCRRWCWHAFANSRLMKSDTRSAWHTTSQRAQSLRERRSWITRIRGLRWMRTDVPTSRMHTPRESAPGTKWLFSTDIRSSRRAVTSMQRSTTILSKAQTNGLYFITDQDSRPQGGAHPYSHLWDNGPDPAAELDRILTVRAAALVAIRRRMRFRRAGQWQR